MIHTLAISGYRSIRDLVMPLDRLTVVTGRNGALRHELAKDLGEARVEGLERIPWEWPAR